MKLTFVQHLQTGDFTLHANDVSALFGADDDIQVTVLDVPDHIGREIITEYHAALDALQQVENLVCHWAAKQGV